MLVGKDFWPQIKDTERKSQIKEQKKAHISVLKLEYQNPLVWVLPLQGEPNSKAQLSSWAFSFLPPEQLTTNRENLRQDSSQLRRIAYNFCSAN